MEEQEEEILVSQLLFLVVVEALVE